ncbi:MAG TPA: DUF3301 domain-containing protein, partial [Gammaproteobacteria bacterium]|nr:DUF3301 domain-containing protein [Gammaproteobacteria bacterium]
YHYCQKTNLQFLDESIWLTKIWPVMNPLGKLQILRCYDFEFTSSGEKRYRGHIIMRGKQMEKLEVEPHIYPD